MLSQILAAAHQSFLKSPNVFLFSMSFDFSALSHFSCLLYLTLFGKIFHFYINYIRAYIVWIQVYYPICPMVCYILYFAISSPPLSISELLLFPLSSRYSNTYFRGNWFSTGTIQILCFTSNCFDGSIDRLFLFIYTLMYALKTYNTQMCFMISSKMFRHILNRRDFDDNC